MKRPNIVFLLSDDQGWWSLGCTGNQEIHTPNIDRLAREGMRFDDFFCASPVCSPARASLLTGCIPSQHGIHDWLRDDDDRQAAIEYLAGQYSYTKALAAAGYDCALSGKWHMGASEKPQQGFGHWFCHKSGGGPYYGAPMYRDGKLYREERYVTDAITEDALSYLDSRAGQENPFFLYVGYTAPHAPWLHNHPKAYTDLYEDCPFNSVPHLPRHPDSIYLTDEVAKDVRGNLIGYYAAVTAMDAGIGRILEKLDSLGMTEDTLVVFTSDNGFSCGHHGFWGKGNATFPLNMYEESVKVPFIARHPGRIPAGTVCDALGAIYAKSPQEQATFRRIFDHFFVSLEQKQAEAKAMGEAEEELARRRAQMEEDLTFQGKQIPLREDLREVYLHMPEDEREKLRKRVDRYRGNAERAPGLYDNFIQSIFLRTLL